MYSALTALEGSGCLFEGPNTTTKLLIRAINNNTHKLFDRMDILACRTALKGPTFRSTTRPTELCQ
ncbi:uncharacterized protein PgNI_10010 [Pyricularia grisea]|uniref:Uncharacterized protein n=1 Tax=Pyricularia grisea TaxID=148305 RepID=A0A6P8ATI2_PYRGI|nr:uncharacterized protein PgNI_10010 [Pyricularia grisea]TLD05423.1 hypothetical protein PgNI_10010 [Pyricularia grisea]